MTRLHRLSTDRSGTAAAELALVLPLLLTMMFSTFELGNYFLAEHVVQKAVRDAAKAQREAEKDARKAAKHGGGVVVISH